MGWLVGIVRIVYEIFFWALAYRQPEERGRLGWAPALVRTAGLAVGGLLGAPLLVLTLWLVPKLTGDFAWVAIIAVLVVAPAFGVPAVLAEFWAERQDVNDWLHAHVGGTWGGPLTALLVILLVVTPFATAYVVLVRLAT